MTERWRKKLEGIDGASPSDDVFERAKEGPRHRDDALPGPRMSTRIVTIVAAFLVFALAISVFAIPALRMGNTTAGDGSLGMFPLWPAQTPDALLQLQARADGGEADWALDPTSVALRFGADVMGWEWTEASPAHSKYCGTDAAVWQPSWPQSTGPSASPIECVAQPTPGPGGAPTPVVGSFPILDLTSCSGDLCIGSAEFVQVYQPLQQGPGHVWAVLQAWAPGIQLSVAAGQNVRDGASVSAGYYADESLIPTLAYASCGASGASSAFDGLADPTRTSLSVGRGIALDVALPASQTCSGSLQPGYVWAATSSESLAASDGTIAKDPVQSSGTHLSGLTAAPVTMIFPSVGGETTAPTSPTPDENVSPTSGPISWTTYTDPLGWTIAVPDQWVMEYIDGSDGRRTHAGAAFISGTPLTSDSEVGSFDPPPGGVTVMIQHIEGGDLSFGDDSSFPMSFHQDEGAVQEIDFRGDGLDFVATVESGDGGPLTSTQEEVVQRMVASIRFQPWSVGETRSNNWTATGSVLPASSAEWIAFQGAHYVASNVDGVRQLLGPAPECASGTGTFEVRESGVAGISCPDGTSGDWDFSTGEPQPGNSARFDRTLPAYVAERSWDGMLLAQLPS